MLRSRAGRGWTVVDSYTDRAISGASLLRPGIQELISDAMRGKFVVVLAEAMDRLSRDQEDIAGLFKRMAFSGVRIVTLSEGVKSLPSATPFRVQYRPSGRDESGRMSARRSG
jgi:DNA invertase Pin-like site-specific DNA recombinase